MTETHTDYLKESTFAYDSIKTLLEKKDLMIENLTEQTQTQKSQIDALEKENAVLIEKTARLEDGIASQRDVCRAMTRENLRLNEELDKLRRGPEEDGVALDKNDQGSSHYKCDDRDDRIKKLEEEISRRDEVCDQQKKELDQKDKKIAGLQSMIRTNRSIKSQEPCTGECASQRKSATSDAQTQTIDSCAQNLDGSEESEGSQSPESTATSELDQSVTADCQKYCQYKLRNMAFTPQKWELYCQKHKLASQEFSADALKTSLQDIQQNLKGSGCISSSESVLLFRVRGTRLIDFKGSKLGTPPSRSEGEDDDLKKGQPTLDSKVIDNQTGVPKGIKNVISRETFATKQPRALETSTASIDDDEATITSRSSDDSTDKADTEVSLQTKKLLYLHPSGYGSMIRLLRDLEQKYPCLSHKSSSHKIMNRRLMVRMETGGLSWEYETPVAKPSLSDIRKDVETSTIRYLNKVCDDLKTLHERCESQALKYQAVRVLQDFSKVMLERWSGSLDARDGELVHESEHENRTVSTPKKRRSSAVCVDDNAGKRSKTST